LISSFGWYQSFLLVANIHRDGRGLTTFSTPYPLLGDESRTFWTHRGYISTEAVPH
jgi:hypothetical protein